MAEVFADVASLNIITVKYIYHQVSASWWNERHKQEAHPTLSIMQQSQRHSTISKHRNLPQSWWQQVTFVARSIRSFNQKHNRFAWRPKGNNLACQKKKCISFSTEHTELLTLDNKSKDNEKFFLGQTTFISIQQQPLSTLSKSDSHKCCFFPLQHRHMCRKF